jgi:shikimate kinase
MKAREPIYRDIAHLVVQTELRPPQSVAREILGKLNELEIDEHA